MIAKHLLTIACSAFLLAGMGAALAQDGAATDHPQDTSYESDMNTSQTTQNQTLQNSENAQDSDNASDTGVDEMSAADSDAMSTSAATTESLHEQAGSAQEKYTQTEQMGMANNKMPESQAEQTGRVVGTLIDATGHVQGYVIRTGKTGDNGARQYVVVPQERVQAVSNVTAEEPSTAGSSTTGQDNHGMASHKQKRLFKQMYRQLQKQAVEIHALKQRLGLQNAWSQRRSQTSGIRQEGPLGQVAHVVVDRSGRVQAIVLDSGVVLASHQWAKMAQSQSNGNASDAMATDDTHDARQGEQQRPAIIIFKPQQ